MTDISDDDLVGLSEFGLLTENAEQAGVTGPLPSVRRVEADGISALKWGEESPRVVFFHGGGQNAHTWDTVIVGLGVPALAVDLPGHGHSAWREDGDYSPQHNAEAVAPVISELAPDAELVVGMSLGGLTAIGLGAVAPQLVRELVLVDVTPSAMKRVTDMTKEQQGTVSLMQGDREFPSFDAILEITAAAAPHRDRKSLRRGVFHNTRQLDNGTWTWRWDTIREFPDFDGLWDDVTGLSAPVRLVRGGTSGFVTDEDADELARRAKQFRGLQVVENSGHSVQSDQPLVLIEILRGVLTAADLLRPAVCEDGVHEVVADEPRVEAFKDVGVAGAECRLGPVFHAVVERRKNLPLEIGPGVRGGDGLEVFGRQVVTADTEHVRLDARRHQRGLGCQELRHPGRGVQRDAQPHLLRVGRRDVVLEQEVARRVGAVDLEAKRRSAVALGQPDVVKHRSGVEQLQIRLQTAASALQGPEDEHSAGVVEQ